MCTKSQFESENEILQKIDYKHANTDNFRRTAYRLSNTCKRYIVVEYFFEDGKPCDIDRSGRRPQLKSRRETIKKTIEENPMLGPKAVMVANVQDVLETTSADMPRNQSQVKMLFIKRKHNSNYDKSESHHALPKNAH